MTPDAPALVYVRRGRPEDLKVLYALEAASDQDEKYSERDFSYLLGRRVFGVLVCLASPGPRPGSPGEAVVGYLAYKKEKGFHYLLSLAVNPAAARRGVGRALVHCWKEMEGKRRRDHLVAVARAGNLRGQLFLKACGFKCYREVEGYFDSPPESGLQFHWKRPKE